ncbi:MAG: phosphotransferase, partial [Dehalococcoidia bacterium]
VEWGAIISQIRRKEEIARKDAERIGEGEGFTGSLVRLRLTTEPPDRIPPLIGKQATAHDTTRELMRDFGGYDKEVHFYRDFADQVSLPSPRCFAAEYDPDTGAFVLLLEDLAPGRVGDQVEGATLETARQVVDALAEFHARWWNTEDLAAARWLLPPDDVAADFIRLFDEGMPAVRELWGARYPELTSLVSRTRRFLPEVFEMFASGDLPRPYTVVHGDMRLDNLFFPTDEGGRFAVVDWQGIALGHPANDLSYWLVLSLPVDLRRSHEESLLARYHRGLRRHGVGGYSLRALRRDYRNTATVLLGGAPVLFNNLDMSSDRGQALVDAIGVRVDAAMKDLNAARTLRILPWYLRGLRAQRATARLLGDLLRRVQRAGRAARRR